ncbi:prenyltransferase alpha subunit [Botrytis cinerea]
MGIYEKNPIWDDVVPIAQDDGEGALAQIAYTDEYAEAMGYLRAVMASKEYSPRVLELTEHIITLNAAHYTVWLYRATTLFALSSSVADELAFMFDEDAKNYHVWSYRQYLVLKLDMFNEAELKSVEDLIRRDVRNNSAWSYRFFLVFSDPKYSTKGLKANEFDEKIPKEIVDREIEYAKSATYEAPQNQSSWNYLRGF